MQPAGACGVGRTGPIPLWGSRARAGGTCAGDQGSVSPLVRAAAWRALVSSADGAGRALATGTCAGSTAEGLYDPLDFRIVAIDRTVLLRMGLVVKRTNSGRATDTDSGLAPVAVEGH